MKKSLNNTEEHQDDNEIIQKKIQDSIRFLEKCEYPIILTGAGVSTDSNIPDYRSGFNTILKTGPGKWESEENKQIYIQNKKQTIKPVLAINAFPNLNHYYIANLINEKLFKKVITSNVDNLHFKSGISQDDILELHGNISQEICDSCQRIYYRDYYCRPKEKKHQDNNQINIDHTTPRKCLVCKEQLKDNMIFFGEFMRPQVTQKSMEICNEADFLLVLGTSLHVQSSSVIVQKMLNKKMPVLFMNLQKTKYDEKNSVIKINGKLDQSLKVFSEQLLANSLIKKINTSNNIVGTRYIQISYIVQDLDSAYLEIRSEDYEMQERAYIKEVIITYSQGLQSKNQEVSFKDDFQGKQFKMEIKERDAKKIIGIQLIFYAKLGEKDYIYNQDILENGNYFSSDNQSAFVFLRTKLIYDFQNQIWKDSHVKDTYK